MATTEFELFVAMEGVTDVELWGSEARAGTSCSMSLCLMLCDY